MPVLDTPITTDDRNLKKVLSQKLPVMLMLHRGELDKPLDDAMRKLARKHANELLVVRVDVAANPATLAQYHHPSLPALITLKPGGLFSGRTEKSRAENARPNDVRNHAAHLLTDEPLPAAAAPAEESSGKGSGPRPIAVTDQTWQSVVLKSKEPVLVDFWASWCAPCRAVAPYVEQLAGQYKGKLKVAKLDTDAHQAIARRYQIQSIPTFIVFQNGEPVQRMSGANPGAIKRMIDLTLDE